jgi:hypothetical protein
MATTLLSVIYHREEHRDANLLVFPVEGVVLGEVSEILEIVKRGVHG